MEKTIINIPRDYIGYSEIIVETINEIIIEQYSEAYEVKLLKPSIKKISPQEIGDFMIYLGTGAGVWFCKKWIDTYLWEALKNKIDKKSKAIVEWLISESKK